jgi:hypothetical protein
MKSFKLIEDYFEIIIESKDNDYLVLLDKKFLFLLEEYHINIILTNNGTVPYVRIQSKKNSIERHYLHRYVMNQFNPVVQIDHKNSNTLDCRVNNLREATNAQNSQNVSPHKDSKTGIRGVCWSKQTNKWRGTVFISGKQYGVGHFDKLEDAEHIVKEFRAKHMPFSQEATNE